MIPNDLASRLRTILESTVQPLVAVKEIPANLPEFSQGQTFRALIQSPLPNGTFKALVAGKTVTLALSENVQEGDVMELVVTEQKNGTIFAKVSQSNPAPETNPANTPRPVLSPAGQLISQLLTGNRSGQNAMTELARSAPLLSAPPSNGAPLANALQQAVQESGLFYEAHQAQWLNGRFPLEALLREPQGQLSPLLQIFRPALQQGSALPPAVSLQAPESELTASPEPIPEGQHHNALTQAANNKPIQGQSAAPNLINNERLLTEHAQSDTARNEAATQHGKASLRIPEALTPLVGQQLETLATQQAVWFGQIWPGQTLFWLVEDPNRGSQQDAESAEQDDEAPKEWRSSLRLELPMLGDIEAQLILTPAGLAVRLSAAQADAVQQLRLGEERLTEALSGVGIELTGLAVEQLPAKPGRLEHADEKELGREYGTE